MVCACFVMEWICCEGVVLLPTIELFGSGHHTVW